MLLALLIGTALAAVAAPIAMGVFDGDDDEDEAIAETEEDTSDTGSLLTKEGANHVIDGTIPANVIDGFEPGTDRATLKFPDWDANLEVRNDEDGSVKIDYEGAEGPVSVVFSGLSDIPAADIDISVTDPETGEDTVICLLDCLTDPSILDGGTGEGEIEDEALEALSVLDPVLPDVPTPEEALQPIAPVDPDAPDVPGPDLPDVAPIGPLDPDLPDVPGVDLGDVVKPLTPLDPDTIEDIIDLPDAIVSDLQDGQLPDVDPVLEPLGVSEGDDPEPAEDETPIAPMLPDEDEGLPLLDPLGPAVQPVLPGLGQSQLVLRGPDDILIAAEVSGFDVSEDILQISVDMVPGAPPPVVSVAPMSDGSGAEVLLDGTPMAVLLGAPDAGPENIRVVPFEA